MGRVWHTEFSCIFCTCLHLQMPGVFAFFFAAPQQLHRGTSCYPVTKDAVEGVELPQISVLRPKCRALHCFLNASL